MANSTSDHEKVFQAQSVTIKEFAHALKEARETHRQIVPIVGAGLSADSGFPVITAIVRYFGKLYRYIEQRGPLRQNGVPEIEYLETLFKEYKEKPWRFVEDFGWPDRFQLNQDLYASLQEDPEQTSDRSVETAVRKGLDTVLFLVNQPGLKAYEKLSSEIAKMLDVAKTNLEGVEKDEVIAALNNAQIRLSKDSSRSSAFDIVGDWRRLILSFTNYRSDYADALFARFGSSRQPGQGHRFLAFLIRFLAVPTVFTFNFDSLIEQALESEGDRPRVFGMERGAALPHAELVRNHLSVIKMHGSTHALLLDEQLDRPLSDEYLKRFAQVTGSNPLLLVVGCSESDQRLRDLVSDVVVNRSSPDAPCVLWLHYEDESPDFLNKLLEKDVAARQQKILTCPTNNPGAALQHLYSWLTGCHPAGSLPYIAHVQQPVHTGKKVDTQHTPATWPKPNRFELISSLPKQNPIPSAAHELLKRANYWTRYGYYFIWIDLESVHTFAGVVGAIIDQCRKYDPDLAPSVLPVDIDGLRSEGTEGKFLNATIDLAVNRVARALRRTRYYLALDGLETYVWPATTHHGLSHMAMQNDANARLRNLGEFLKRLINSKEELGESLVGISVDKPISRHESDLSNHLQLDDVVQELEKVSTNSNPFPEDAVEFNYDDHFEYLRAELPLVSLKTVPGGVVSGADDEQKARLALILYNLSCFRRMRPLVSVRHLIEPLLHANDRQGDDAVDRMLQRFVDELHGQVLQQLEGGGYWFTRTIRNKVYAENTRYTDTGEIRICLTGRNRENETVPIEKRQELCRNSAFQLCLAAMTHQRIARTWYTRTFVQSQDTFSFLEYTYHRISSIRSLVKLRRLMQTARAETIIAEPVLEGIEAWMTLNEQVDPPENSHRPEFDNDDFILPDVSPTSRRSDAVKLIDEIEDALKKRHGDELGSLYRAWTRSEVPLRTQIPAEQLLHWCRELLTDDLRHRCNRVVIGYRNLLVSENHFRYELEYHKLPCDDGQSDELIDQNIEEGVIKAFRQYLQDLQAKIWIERSDYKTCIGARWRHLLDAADEEMRDEMIEKYDLSSEGPVELEAAKALEEDDEFIRSCDEAQCHRLLDIVNCKLQLELETSASDSEIIEKRKAPRQLLERVKDQLTRKEAITKRKSKSLDVNNLNEAWLRLLHLQAENQMGRVTVFTHDGFTAERSKWAPASLNLDEVRQTISAGLERIKTHDSRTHQAPRSTVLDPTTDGALYLQYRSVFYLLKGRAEWLSRPEGFDKAHWCFEMARGGLGNHSPLMMALIELYGVEALLGRAREKLRGTSSDEEARKACDLARGLYDSARGGLQRARESLLASRRNVIWRKFFFRLTTQYHSDRLLLGYALLKPMVEELKASKSGEDKAKYRQSCEELLRHYLLRLRRAYQSLLTAVDLYLPQSFEQQNTAPCPNRFRWLYRTWWELTLCGYGTGRLALSLDPNTNHSDADKFLTCQLQWLNETAGIEASELGKFIAGKIALLNKKYETIESKYSNRVGAHAALEERSALINLATDCSEANF